MPLYEYVCQSCKQTFETIRPFTQQTNRLPAPNAGGRIPEGSSLW